MSSQYSPFLGPTAPESNPPIHPEYYRPRFFVITALGLGAVTTVTTAKNHDYVITQQIRLLIPFGYGSVELDGQTGYVTSIPAPNQVIVNIFSQNATPFIASPPYARQVPQILAIGDANTGAINGNGRIGNGTFIPGSFINISPS